jgi:hypothetical protein
MRTRRWITSGSAVLAAALSMAACGGAGGSPNRAVASLNGHTTTTAKAGKGDKKSFEDGMLEYARCMRQHGVDMPDPVFKDTGGGGGGFAVSASPKEGGGSGRPDDTAMKAAASACQPIMDKAQQNAPRPSPAEEAKMKDQALKFARCMRQHGVDMPDPTFDGNGDSKIVIGGGSSDSPSSGNSASNGATPPKMDAAFDAAAKACSKDGGPGIGLHTEASK